MRGLFFTEFNIAGRELLAKTNYSYEKRQKELAKKKKKDEKKQRKQEKVATPGQEDESLVPRADE